MIGSIHLQEQLLFSTLVLPFSAITRPKLLPKFQTVCNIQPKNLTFTQQADLIWKTWITEKEKKKGQDFMKFYFSVFQIRVLLA